MTKKDKDDDRTLFERNSKAIKDAEKQGKVGGPADQQRTGYGRADKDKPYATGNKAVDDQMPNAMKNE